MPLKASVRLILIISFKKGGTPALRLTQSTLQVKNRCNSTVKVSGKFISSKSKTKETKSLRKCSMKNGMCRCCFALGMLMKLC